METLKRISFVALAALAFSAFANAQTQTVIFEETFAGCDGNEGSTSAFKDQYADNSGWSLTKGYSDAGCIRLGTGSDKGFAISPVLTDQEISDEAVLTFNCKSWAGDGSIVYVYIGDISSIDDCSTSNKIADCNLTEEFSEFVVTISDGISVTDKLAFVAKNKTSERFFLDDVKITVESTTTTDPSEDDDEEGEGENDDPSGETIPTAIKSPSHISSDAPVYNLQGQRVDSNAKGILIQNGKKMIRK